jgi:rhamnosyltransferase
MFLANHCQLIYRAVIIFEFLRGSDVTKQIAIGVVTYKLHANLTLRLQSAINLKFSIYIFDNSPEDALIRDFCKEYDDNDVRYITCGKNVGLGFGISSVCAQAYYDSFSALIFFDQDTVFDHSTLAFIEEFYNQNSSLASSYSAVWFNSKRFADAGDGNQFMFKDVLMAINSGSLFFLENLEKLNWMNEKYFVDCVDYEFCLNSSNNNYKIGECSNTPGFDHDTEQADVKYFIFGKERKLRKYSGKRVLDTVRASTKLMFTSIYTRNNAFTVAIIRSLAGYLFWQFISRILRVSKSN